MMQPAKPPIPVCHAFLVCEHIAEGNGKCSLIGLTSGLKATSFPAARPFGVFGRVSSAHGGYQMEVQLQDSEGKIVWRDGPPEPWRLDKPLSSYEIKMNVCPVFPGPGIYHFVLTANGEEVARQFFQARVRSPAAPNEPPVQPSSRPS